MGELNERERERERADVANVKNTCNEPIDIVMILEGRTEDVCKGVPSSFLSRVCQHMPCAKLFLLYHPNIWKAFSRDITGYGPSYSEVRRIDGVSLQPPHLRMGANVQRLG